MKKTLMHLDYLFSTWHINIIIWCCIIYRLSLLLPNNFTYIFFCIDSVNDSLLTYISQSNHCQINTSKCPTAGLIVVTKLTTISKSPWSTSFCSWFSCLPLSPPVMLEGFSSASSSSSSSLSPRIWKHSNALFLGLIHCEVCTSHKAEKHSSYP